MLLLPWEHCLEIIHKVNVPLICVICVGVVGDVTSDE